MIENLNLSNLEMNFAYSACVLAENMKADAIITYTYTGDSARRLAGLGPGCPIFAITDNRKTFYQLGLVWNVYPVYIEKLEKPNRVVEAGIEKLKAQGVLEQGDFAIISGGSKLLKNQENSQIACGIIRV